MSAGGRQAGSGKARAQCCLLLALVAHVALGAAGCSRDATTYPEVRAERGEVAVRLEGIEKECGRFFTYRADGGRKVDFLVYRDSAGTAHAVLDACKTCYRWKKGYRIEGPEVVCIKCDMRFTLDGLERGAGSCVPIKLASELRGETLHVPAAELEAGARYF